MRIKKILLSGLLFSAFILGHLQSQAQVQIGVRAGLNLSGMIEEVGDVPNPYDDSKLNPRVHAGVTFNIPIADEFYVQPAVLFSTKGGQLNSSTANGTQPDKVILTPYYLEVPVNIIYKPELGDGHLLLGAGPYVAYGLGGKWKVVTTTTTAITDKSLIFVNDRNDASADNSKTVYGKPIDYGANVLVGYEFSNRLSVQLNGQLGVPNLRPKLDGQEPTDGKRKNFGFGVSVGCIL